MEFDEYGRMKQKDIRYYVDGKEFNLHQLCQSYGYKYGCVWRRLQWGWTIEEAFNYCGAHPETWIGIEGGTRKKIGREKVIYPPTPN